jgi:poly-gamma-glutamate capsule biosynthesis protein CapA/YwtB (metallophosphatase superfamily)
LCADYIHNPTQTRRHFFRLAGVAAVCAVAGPKVLAMQAAMKESLQSADKTRLLTLFLCGDVMTGRGIDQVLPHPGNPQLYEPYIRDARDYVRLAERTNGPVKQPVEFDYPWGDALAELERAVPDVRIINLETTITVSDRYLPKGINYRMHPANISCLTAAGVDCCALANNHVLDWGFAGLQETLATLDVAGIRRAGAGRNLEEGMAPAVISVPGKGRVLVFSCGLESSGIGRRWAADSQQPGVHLLPDLSMTSVDTLAEQVRRIKRAGDIAIVSIHWGGNWDYSIPRLQRDFAHGLIDRAGIDVIHGHSSHHVKGIEVYKERPILYGCGDLLSDYEGITGHEEFRGELGLLYFLSLESATGRLQRFEMTPTRLRKLRINSASREEAQWLAEVLNREGRSLGSSAVLGEDLRLTLQWSAA